MGSRWIWRDDISSPSARANTGKHSKSLRVHQIKQTFRGSFRGLGPRIKYSALSVAEEMKLRGRRQFTDTAASSQTARPVKLLQGQSPDKRCRGESSYPVKRYFSQQLCWLCCSSAGNRALSLLIGHKVSQGFTVHPYRISLQHTIYT